MFLFCGSESNAQLSTLEEFTPLMIACQNGHEDIAVFLLNSQADINRQNIDNETALMIACRHQLVETIGLLLSSGANPNLQSTMG